MNEAASHLFGGMEKEALRRVLLVRLDNLGDVLLTTPAFRAVRQALPEAHLALLAGPAGCEVGRLNPDVDETILYHAPNEDVYFELPQNPKRELAAIKTLEERDFDAAIIFTSYKQSALPAAYLCYLAGIPVRAAGSFEGPGSLLTHRHRYEETVPPKHETLRGLELTESLSFPPVEPEMVLVPRTEDEEGAAQLLERHGVERFVLVHPGASASSRAYPPERYAEVVEELAGQSGLPVLVTGGPNEEDLTRRVAGSAGVSLGGETSFGVFASLAGRAAVVVTNNTGTTHVASALKRPVVTVFAGTNPAEQWGPWRTPNRLLTHPVPCAPCYKRVCPIGHECLTGIAPGIVVDAALRLLHESLLPVVEVLR
ncbi:MAG: ADP-heptose--lipooligosaccharide heptosyltransferase II [uncultured Rubrobacteraceae bacterium]|uniref:ADP-heptose--lipooligosaccharide heptosyltransferase II n=1 Tax=uncultured Rubrobacteraceae bacterium TaxID=349277 RepID=A0A6J4QW68_9ACTN|nr:MAG: ADP-heptose--lipooligosaccharide heptosyltransferase II [uncultured Rubrobacteraceae bacterium]